jgi:hypothetical protein
MTGGPADRATSDAARDRADMAALAGETGWVPAATRLLANLGFSLIHSDQPGAPGGAFLLVAFRTSPTFRHFDPESIGFWVVRGGQGRLAEYQRGAALPARTPVSWGKVRVVDRLGIDNRFLTFGGTLRAEAADADTTVLALVSPGPIARWSGHSQPHDPLASEIGAFFGRLMVRVDFEPGAERRLAEAPPIELYAAFVRDAHDRLRAAERLRASDPAFTNRIAAEVTRLEATARDAWTAGAGLLADLELGH